jgi:hypothetical protein
MHYEQLEKYKAIIYKKKKRDVWSLHATSENWTGFAFIFFW